MFAHADNEAAIVTGRVFVIGDIHGCVDELDRMLDAISPESDDTVCFLGDYIDRGPSPRGVVDRLLRFQVECPTSVFLKGNHEDMLLAYIGQPGRYADSFAENGGAPTLANYGISHLRGRAAAEVLPPEHLQFFLALRTTFEVDPFFCVHAGVDPRRPLDLQDDEDMLWIREDFTKQPHSFERTIVFGHTPYREVYLHLPYKIGLDTGVVYGNKLSCLELREKRLLQVHRRTLELEQRSLEAYF